MVVHVIYIKQNLFIVNCLFVHSFIYSFVFVVAVVRMQ